MKYQMVVVVLLALFASACSSNTVTPDFSDLKISITQDERLVLTGKTSLPDGTKLSALILQLKPERKGLFSDAPLDYPSKLEVEVVDGGFVSWFPSAYKNGLAAGGYTLQIGLLPDQAKLLGPKNAWLSGPGVTTETNGHKLFTVEIEVDLPEIPAHG